MGDPGRKYTITEGGRDTRHTVQAIRCSTLLSDHGLDGDLEHSTDSCASGRLTPHVQEQTLLMAVEFRVPREQQPSIFI